MSERRKTQGGEPSVPGDDLRHPASRLVQRVTRIVQLDILLRERTQALSTNHLCTELGVSKRTLRRDLNVLRRAGQPVGYKRAEGGYRISVPTTQAVAVLCAREIGALLAAASGATPSLGSEFEQRLHDARGKLNHVLESEFAETMPEIQKCRREFTAAAER